MSLQFILGRSGAGKSRYLAESIIKESMEHPENSYIVLVPEQATMQTKRQFIGLHPDKALLNIDILNFPRFAYRILEETKAGKLTVLDDVGKSLILRKLAMENQEYLKVLGKNIHKIGYIQEIKSVLSELEQYRVSKEALSLQARSLEKRPLLQYKLEDLAVLYRAYQEFLSGKYIVSEELLEVMASYIDRSETVKNSIFVLDGFTGFTPVQYELLKGLLRYGKKVLLTVTIDTEGYPVRWIKEQELFAFSKKTIVKLTELAKETGTELDPPVLLNETAFKKAWAPRFDGNKEMQFLEEHLFRYDEETYEKELKQISIHTLLNPYTEVLFVSRRIEQLVREKGHHYRDFAVVCGDLNIYAPYMEQIFEEAGIPYYKDNKRCILENPMLECIVSALEMVLKDFSYESVFRYLRSGMSDLTPEQIDKLENYVLAAGIRGSRKWKKEFTRRLRSMKDEDVLELEQIRRLFMEEIKDFVEGVRKKGTVREKTRHLYQFLEEREVQQRLADFEAEFREKGELVLAKEYQQIYRLLMDLLDIYVTLLGEETVTLQEYRDILQSGFEQTMVGTIPSNTDQVMAGDIERSRMEEVKVLFLLGCNDGLIPKAGGKTSLLSELEREILRQQKLELAPGAREWFYTQKFYLYMNLTKPKEYLHLTFAQLDNEGKTLKPSYLIGSLKKLFPKLKVREENPWEAAFIMQQAHVQEYLLRGLSGEAFTREWEAIFTWYRRWEQAALKKCEAGKPKGDSASIPKPDLEKLLGLHFYRNKENRISQAAAKALYGNLLEGSVTRLEQYAACAYAHFLSYGLRLREREEFTFAETDLGTVFHKTLDAYARHLKKKRLSWTGISQEESERILEKCLADTLEEYGQSNLYETARNRYMEDRMRRILKRTLWSIRKQLEGGQFTPERFEIVFERKRPLDESADMVLRGRIDRLDTFETDDRLYLKVLDYKSGGVKFNLTDVYLGLQLQLPMYLIAAEEYMEGHSEGKEIVPAGILYSKIADPVIDREEGDSEEALEEKLFQEFKLNGMVREEEEIIRMFDQAVEKKSAIVSVGYNKDGSLSKSSEAYSEKDFSTIESYVNQKTEQFGKEILSGQIEVNPIKTKNFNSCSYCAYRKICPFDGKKMAYRKAPEEKKQEIIEKMKRKIHGSKVDEGTTTGN